MTLFPDANYFIASSRLRPGLDGGYTVATMRRALQFAEVGGVQPTLLAFDFWPDYEPFRQRFIELGLATEQTVMRNIFVELRAEPQVLRTAARARGVVEEAPSLEVTIESDTDAAGIPWRTIARTDDGTIAYTDFLGEDGAPLFRIPFVGGRADWWREPILIDVFDLDGSLVGQLDGFRGLYQTWVDHVVAAAPDKPSILVVEARQVGEMLIGPREYSLVHTVHNAHTLPPYRWDSPMDETWSGWFETLEGYDAIVWLTPTQRDDVHRRFGEHPGSVVIPHAAEPVAEFPDPARRDANGAVVLARLAAQKRVDHAIRAWAIVHAAKPDAHLDIYGDGVLRSSLQELVDELGLGDVVTLHGHVSEAAEQLLTAGMLLVSSNYDGQSLVVLEALGRACPVIAYDVSYGPLDMIEPGVNGELVPSGDIEQLAAAALGLLGDQEKISRYSRGAYDWARSHDIEPSMQSTADLFQSLTARP